MESALSEFFDTEHGYANLREWVIGKFQVTSADPVWHAKDFCRRLIATNPFHINSAKHSAFWDSFDAFCQRMLRTDPGGLRDFSIIVNRGEIMYELHYMDALSCILSTLVSVNLMNRIISVYNLPEHILLAFLKRKEMRDHFFERFAGRCEDQLDVYALYDQGLISHDVLYNTLDEQYDRNGENCILTPPPELHKDRMNVEYSDDSIDPTKLVFPERVLQPVFTTPSKIVVGSLLAFYSYLWTEVSKIVDSVQYEYKLAHGPNCKCHVKVLDMRVLFPLLRMYVQQSLDAKTLVRRDARAFFRLSKPLCSVIERVAHAITQHLTGAPTPPELDMILYSNAKQAENFETRFADAMGKNTRWSICGVTEMPLPLLLHQLDVDYLFGHAVPSLHHFLANKPRDNYIAYEMPVVVSFFDLRNTLKTLVDTFGDSFPPIRDIFPIKSRSNVYVVCKPAAMTVLRCLMLSERVVVPVRNISSTVLELPQSPLLLRNYTMCVNDFAQEVNDAALYCIVRLMTFYIHHGREWTDSTISTPADAARFAVYRHLPRLCSVLCTEEVETQKRNTILLQFLCQNARHCCDTTVLTDFVKHLADRVSEDDDMYSLAKKMESAYRSKRLSGQIQISRKADSALEHSALYEMLLGTNIFSNDEIVFFASSFKMRAMPSQSKRSETKHVTFSNAFLRGNNAEVLMKQYEDSVIEFWKRKDFQAEFEKRMVKLEVGCCAEQKGYTTLLDRGVVSAHYNTSRIGHGFRTVCKTDSQQPLSGLEKQGLASELARLEYTYHSNGTLDPVDKYMAFNWVQGDTPLCVPLSLELNIHFEDAFFLLVGDNWPFTADESLDCITRNGDLPMTNDRNVLDYLAQSGEMWKPSTRVTASAGGNHSYVQCIETLQETHT